MFINKMDHDACVWRDFNRQNALNHDNLPEVAAIIARDALRRNPSSKETRVAILCQLAQSQLELGRIDQAKRLYFAAMTLKVPGDLGQKVRQLRDRITDVDDANHALIQAHKSFERRCYREAMEFAFDGIRLKPESRTVFENLRNIRTKASRYLRLQESEGNCAESLIESQKENVLRKLSGQSDVLTQSNDGSECDYE